MTFRQFSGPTLGVVANKTKKKKEKEKEKKKKEKEKEKEKEKKVSLLIFSLFLLPFFSPFLHI